MGVGCCVTVKGFVTLPSFSFIRVLLGQGPIIKAAKDPLFLKIWFEF